MSGRIAARAAEYGAEKQLDTKTSAISTGIGMWCTVVAKASSPTVTARPRSQTTMTARRASRSTSGASKMLPNTHGT
jgi:hypothetical protein